MRLLTLFPRQHLRWKLAWSYTLVTLSAIVLAGSLLVFFFAITITPDRVTNLLDVFIRETIPSLEPALASEPPDTETLDAWLQSLVFQNTVRPANAAQPAWRVDLTPAFIAQALFVDQHGNVVAFEPAQTCSSMDATCLSYDVLARLDLVLTNSTADVQTIQLRDEIVLIYPIVSESNATTAGALVITLAWPQQLWQRIRLLVAPFMRAIVLSIILTALLGTLFGYWTARTLSQRLEKLEHATREWEAGHFTITVQDDAQDELGALARRLNEMAAQLQHLVQTREMVAMLEERHRLARELHDAVKQHLFSASMQLGVVQALLETEPFRARQALHETQRLLRHAQEELTALIHELRPLPLRDHPFPKAVQIYATQWAEHTGCSIEVHADEVPHLPLAHQIALFRLLQEALNNVERHSQASCVQVRLESTPLGVRLSMKDDGIGFDVNKETEGIGLVSMRERVRALGGELTIQSTYGHGTHIIARVPYPQQAREAT